MSIRATGPAHEAKRPRRPLKPSSWRLTLTSQRWTPKSSPDSLNAPVDRKDIVVTEPVDDSYPASWTPKEVRDRDDALEAPAVEAWLASLSGIEFAKLVARTRGGQR